MPGNGADFQGNELKKASPANNDILFEMVHSTNDGLSDNEVIEKRKVYGVNEIAHEKAPSWYLQLFQAFLNPFIAVLIILAIISLVMDVVLARPGEGYYKTVIVVSVMVMLSFLLRFWQEFTITVRRSN